VAPRLALAQGLASFDIGEVQGNHMNAVAAGTGVANPLGFDVPPVSNLSLKNSLSVRESATIGMADAPGLIKAAQIPCTLSEARFMFAAIGADKGRAKVYEVACQEGLGYVIAAPEKAGAVPVIFDCMAMMQPVRGKPSPLTCKLAGNADPAKGLGAIMARSGRGCAVEKGRYLGSTEDQNIYEVACHEGGGYILNAAKAPGGTTTANTCLAYGAASNLKCILLTPEQQLGGVAGLVAASGKPCAVTDKRYLGSTAAHHDYFEVACSGGKGYMLEVDPAGKLAAATDCLQAADIGGGPTAIWPRLPGSTARFPNTPTSLPSRTAPRSSSLPVPIAPTAASACFPARGGRKCGTACAPGWKATRARSPRRAMSTASSPAS